MLHFEDGPADLHGTTEQRRFKPRLKSAGAVIACLGAVAASQRGFVLPDQLALPAFEAHQRAGRAPLGGLREEDLLAPHDGRGVAGRGQRRLPNDVLFRAPLQRQVLFLAMPLLLSLGFFDLWFDFRSRLRQS